MRLRSRGCAAASPADQRGAALVEFAIVVVLFCALLFGIIDFSNVFNNYNALRQGVREGARQGVVGNVGSDSSCDLHGAPGNATTQELMCLTKNRIGLPASDLYVDVLFDPSYAVNEGLVVCAQSKASSLTGAFSALLDSTWLRSKVEMNIEQAVAGTPPDAGAETVPASTSWSWCTAANPSP